MRVALPRALSSDYPLNMTHRLLSALFALAMVVAPFPAWAQVGRVTLEAPITPTPSASAALNAFSVALGQICQSRMQVLDVPLATLQSGAAICRQTGLLINDALIVALMQQHGLTRLASHDADFDRVPGLMRFAPV